ncbi:hypothetical protein K7432_018241 [Basidiobolus ranarum]|uniref:Chitin-binding type-1 domain-containing protein n=1 Tax=Basidiobolus ranarum TaxID=34480 RepID=A0ABR2WCE9_9FUNG
MKFSIATIAIFASASYLIQPTSAALSVDGTCGNGVECPAGACCSSWGFCGVGEGFCNAQHSTNGQHLPSVTANGQAHNQPSATNMVPSPYVTQSGNINNTVYSGILSGNNTKPEDKYTMSSSVSNIPSAVLTSVLLVVAKYTIY